MRSGLERVQTLTPRSGYAELVAGLAAPWGGDFEAYVRAETGWRPTANTALFGFAQADLGAVTAGLGARVTW